MSSQAGKKSFPNRSRSRHNAETAFQPRIENLEERMMPSGFGPQAWPNGPLTSTSVRADFNGDGKTDVATLDMTTGRLTVMISEGDGSFTTSARNTHAHGPAVLMAGDFNGDGKTDLAAAFRNQNNVTVWLNNGDGTFKPPVSTPLGAARPGEIVTGDFNGDGKTDLAMTDRSSRHINVFLSNGDGSFHAPQMISPWFRTATLATGNFNNDDNLDLYVVDLIGGGHVLLGNGDGSFVVPPQTNPPAPGNSHPLIRSGGGIHAAGVSQIQFSDAVFTVNENTGIASITVTRTGDLSGTATVHYSTSDGTATHNVDYFTRSGTLVFQAGQASQTFHVRIRNDNLGDGSQTLHLTLSHPTGGATLGAQSTADLTIVSAEPGRLRFAESIVHVNEGDRTAEITVERIGGSDGTVSVDYTTSNGSARAGHEYTAVHGTLTFGPGETSKTIEVPLLNDTRTGPDRRFFVLLSHHSGNAARFQPQRATVVIHDNDSALSFSAGAFRANIAAGSALITVRRTGDANSTVTVNYQTSDGTARAGTNYTAVAGTLTFNAGETTKTFAIPLTQSTLLHGAATVFLTLSSPTGETMLGAIARAVLVLHQVG